MTGRPKSLIALRKGQRAEMRTTLIVSAFLLLGGFITNMDNTLTSSHSANPLPAPPAESYHFRKGQRAGACLRSRSSPHLVSIFHVVKWETPRPFTKVEAKLRNWLLNRGALHDFPEATLPYVRSTRVKSSV